MDGQIQIYREADTPRVARQTIIQITQNEFGSIPIIRETEWSDPDWYVFYNEDDDILSFASIIERVVLFDKMPTKVAGISNVITVENRRGKGFGTMVMQEAQKFIGAKLNAEYGLLLCSDDVGPFYSKLGWSCTTATLTYEQPSGKREWGKDTMIYPFRKEMGDYKKIDLNGLPW